MINLINFLNLKNILDNMLLETKKKFEGEIIYGVIEYAKISY